MIADDRLRRWTHLSVDLAGYGKSFWESEPLSLEQHAARVAELVDRKLDGPVVVLGHSMGGVIGTLLGELAPRSVRAFVNVEGNVSPPDCAFSSRAVGHSLESWVECGHRQLLNDLYEDQQEHPDVLRPYCASIQMSDPRAFYRNALELVEISDAETMAAQMAALERPGIFIFGAPRGAGDQSRGLLSQAGVEMVGIPDSGHWPFLDQSDSFVAELSAFLDRLPVRA